MNEDIIKYILVLRYLKLNLCILFCFFTYLVLSDYVREIR